MNANRFLCLKVSNSLNSFVLDEIILYLYYFLKEKKLNNYELSFLVWRSAQQSITKCIEKRERGKKYRNTNASKVLT